MPQHSDTLLKRSAARLARLTIWAGPFAGLLQLLLLGLAIMSLSCLSVYLSCFSQYPAFSPKILGCE